MAWQREVDERHQVKHCWMILHSTDTRAS